MTKSYPLLIPTYGAEEESRVLQAMDSGFLNEGNFCREFERKFAEFVGAKYCHLVTNGRTALYMALTLFSPRTYFIPSTYGIFALHATIEAGHKGITVDVNSEGVLDLEGFDSVVVHANGRLGKVGDGGRGVEDCCQAISHHRPGAISCYSFHSTKQLTCGGIGGAVCTDDKSVYERLAAIKDHGRPERAMGKPVTEVHSGWGSNFKMSELCAAFGLAQLEALPLKLKKLNYIYNVYNQVLGDKVGWFVADPTWRVDCLVPDAATVAARLKKVGIGAQQYYLPLHRQPGTDKQQPMAELLYNKGLYLPSTTTLDDNDIQYICGEVVKALQ